jgi:hypothetical protein
MWWRGFSFISSPLLPILILSLTLPSGSSLCKANKAETSPVDHTSPQSLLQTLLVPYGAETTISHSNWDQWRTSLELSIPWALKLERHQDWSPDQNEATFLTGGWYSDSTYVEYYKFHSVILRLKPELLYWILLRIHFLSADIWIM